MHTRHLTIITNANLIIMIMLSVWQLHRALSKYELIQHKPQASLTEEDLQEFEYEQTVRSISIKPQLDKLRYFIIDPAFKHHVVGVELIGINHSSHIQKPILIHLGWYPNTEAAASVINHTRGTPDIDGILYQPKGRLLRQIPTHNSWPKKLSFIDLETISQALQKPIYQKIIVTKGSTLYDNVTNQNSLALGISRHICYALQFAAFGIIGIYWSKLIRRKKNVIP